MHKSEPAVTPSTPPVSPTTHQVMMHDAQCPVTHHSEKNITGLSQSLSPNRLRALPATRSVSSIPRAPSSFHYSEDIVDKPRWEYPSPQQFYNALLRKGWNFPKENMKPMVLLHNRLNEDAWQEILKWESRSSVEALPELDHFEGLHGKWSNKARLYQLGRCIFPAHFCFTPPFDRHDWIIRRPRTNEKVRYVIDYYSSRESVNGEPVFHLDVRPALDSVGNIRVRLLAAGENFLSEIVIHHRHAAHAFVHWHWQLVAMPRIGPFYALLVQHATISVRTPTLRRRYRWTGTRDIWLRSFGTAGHRSIRQPDSELGIEEFDKMIDKDRSLSDEIESFIHSPEPPSWIPPGYATPSNQEFLRNLRIPTYSNGSPSLLFHDLDVCDSNAIETIFGQREPTVYICNTSGSGKTRRMLEGFTKYWGFYFVAVPDINHVGAPDFQLSLQNMAEDSQWVPDLRVLSSNKRPHQNDLNRRIAWKELRKVLAARVLIFELFLRLAIKVDGELLEKHKRIWLLFQSAWLSRVPHPFCQVMVCCLRNASPKVLDRLAFRLGDIRRQFLPPGASFIFGLDDAQHPARLYPYPFISPSDLDRYRSIIYEIVNVFTRFRIDRVVVSGVGLSLEELRAGFAYGVSKPDIPVFHDLGMFDTWEKLKPFLERYLPAPFLRSPSGYRLEKRIQENLLGRYCISTSFLEYLLMTGLESPHKLLNEYITRRLIRSPADCGEPFTKNEPDLRMEINPKGFDYLNARQATAEVAQSHLPTLGGTPTFGSVTDSKVVGDSKYRRARVRDLNLQIRLQLGHFENSRPAELLVILYLLRILGEPIPLSTIFDFHGVPPEWANEPARVIGRLGGIGLEGATQNQDLAVASYGESIQDILDWLENPDTASAVLLPSNHFGPDLMMRFKLINLDITIVAIAKLQSSLIRGDTTLEPEITANALNSLNKDHFFKRKWGRRKILDAIGRHTVFRFVAGAFPPDLNSKDESVTQALKALGPNVALAKVTLDTFRAKFISEREANNLLGPLAYALQLKQERDRKLAKVP